MGSVLEKCALRLVCLGQLLLHMVDLALQLAQLLHRGPGLHSLEFFLTDPPGGFTEPLDRYGNTAGHQPE